MLIMLNRASIGVCAIAVLLVLYLLAGLFLFTSVSMPAPHRFSRRQSSGWQQKQGEHVEMVHSSRRIRMVWCQPLRFLFSLERPTIALVSFPGSGNTWLRYLLQQATGVNTGSVYKDYGLLKNGFPGECIANSSVSVVKTHERGPMAFKGYSKAVLLVRDPSHAIQAEFNRQGGGHIGYAPLSRYQLRNGKYWAKFVSEQIIKWKKTNLDWLLNFTQPLLVLFYEDFVNDLESSLRELITFVELPIVEDSLKCAMKRREGIYRRKKRLLTIDPFTVRMKEKIESIKQEVYRHLHSFIQNSKEGVS